MSKKIEGQDNSAQAVGVMCMGKLDRRRLLQHSLAGGAALMALPCGGFLSQAFALESAPVVEATWDSDQVRATPVPHRYLHGLIRSHVKFQILLPVAWNGKIAIFTRGFSGTELTTETFQVVLSGAMKSLAWAPPCVGLAGGRLTTRRPGQCAKILSPHWLW